MMSGGGVCNNIGDVTGRLLAPRCTKLSEFEVCLSAGSGLCTDSDFDRLGWQMLPTELCKWSCK
jgi:hypothetical protein